MLDRLISARLKLARAREHFKALKLETDAFVATQPYRITSYADVEQGWHVFRFEASQAPPIRLSVIAGDAVNSVNAALDHLVYALSVTKPPQGTGFPVFVSVNDYGAYRDRLLDGVPAWPDRAIIDAYQPYERALDLDPLRLMRTFSNADKHRVTQPTYGRPKSLRIQQPPGYTGQVIPPKIDGPLYDGAELFRVRLTGPDPPEGGVDVYTRLNLTIAYGDQLIDNVDIGGMILLAAEIIDAF